MVQNLESPGLSGRVDSLGTGPKPLHVIPYLPVYNVYFFP